MSHEAVRPSWALLGSVTALGPLAMGIHVPGIDRIAPAIGETVMRTQLTVPSGRAHGRDAGPNASRSSATSRAASRPPTRPRWSTATSSRTMS